MRGRGTSIHLPNRFEKKQLEEIPLDFWNEEEVNTSVPTQIFEDKSRSILSKNDSPDLPFDYALNPYRGCEHGCIYCYARPYHEYLGLSAGIDFETKIYVKLQAAELLRQTFQSEKWKPQLISMSGVTDCYQPIEKKLGITRSCLEVFVEYLNPLGIITKNALIVRDLDLITQLAQHQCVQVFISLTSLDPHLSRILEPRASSPHYRLKAIESLTQAGIPTCVMMAPIIPHINDVEIPALLEAAFRAGAKHASYSLVRLPHGVETLFEQWLEQYFSLRKKKVLQGISQLGNQSSFETRFKGEGIKAEKIRNLFLVLSRKIGFEKNNFEFSVKNFRRKKLQLSLF